MSERCKVNVGHVGGNAQCQLYRHGDSEYCWVHDPNVQRARLQRKRAEYEQKRHEAARRMEAAQERERKLELLPDFLDAVYQVLGFVKAGDPRLDRLAKLYDEMVGEQ